MSAGDLQLTVEQNTIKTKNIDWKFIQTLASLLRMVRKDLPQVMEVGIQFALDL